MSPFGSSADTALPPRQAVVRGPFQPHGDPHLFYGGGGRAEVLEALLRAVREGATVMRVNGERGSGRTMLSLVLAQRLAERHRVLRHEGVLTPATLLRTLLLELAPQHADLVPVDSEGEALDRDALDVARRSLVVALEERSVDARPLVVVADTAGDGRDADTLTLVESIAATRAGRATAGFGTMPGGARDAAADAAPDAAVNPARAPHPAERRRRRPAVQVCLFRIARPGASRTVPVPGHATGADAGAAPADGLTLRRLTLAEVGEYLNHHMLLFDYHRRHLFTREMTYFVADRSEGVFRTIDTLARNAFTIASVQNVDRPTLSHLLLAGLPPRDEPAPPATSFLSRHRGKVVAVLGSSVVALAATAVMLTTR